MVYFRKKECSNIIKVMAHRTRGLVITLCKKNNLIFSQLSVSTSIEGIVKLSSHHSGFTFKFNQAKFTGTDVIIRAEA
jgi:hypothetical protein